ncbi:hypothetical protein A8L48_18410 [Rhizobium rhizogenes]|nr:hypothetical protein B0909_09875 [Rhizobium rhizogenes]OAM65035.1 hypothetical protein A8L48_18410 [Rhizobium rhizogenes]
MRRNLHTHPISCKPPEAGDDRQGEPGSRGLAHYALKVIMTFDPPAGRRRKNDRTRGGGSGG